MSDLAILANFIQPEEISAGLVAADIINPRKDVGCFDRYGENTSPGSTDMSVAFRNAVAVAEVNSGRAFGTPGVAYHMGTIAGDAIHTTVTSDIEIDVSQSPITIAGTDGVGLTGCTWIRFLDCRANIRIGSFEDTTFAVATSTSRGVIPVSIVNASASSKGHYIWFNRLVSGQSFFTCTTSNLANRASDIQLSGPCVADEAYYGINLANNGDRVRGSYFVNEYNRLWFVYGVDDVNIRCHGGSSPSATSSAGYAYVSTRNTSNIKIRAIYEELNGVIRIADESVTGGLAFTNIDLDIHVKSYGSNLPSTSNEIIAIGTVTGASWDAASTVTMDGIKINFKSDVLPTNPIVAKTSSPNMGVLEVTGIPPAYPAAVKDFTIKQGESYTRGVLGQTLEIAVTNITQANPAVVTAAGHSIPDGTPVVISNGGGMTQIEGQVALISNGDANTFEMTGIDSTAYTAYSAGGAAHVAVKMELDYIASAENNALKSYAVDLNARSDTSGDIAAIEDWRVHTVTNGGGVLTIKEQDKLALSQVGAGSPVGVFVGGPGSELYGYMTGYATTNGGLAMTARQVW